MALFSDKNKESAKASVSGDQAQQLNVVAAIQAHVQWKQRLLSYITSESEERLDPEVVGSDCLCSLGEWIYGQGGEHYGDNPKFQALKRIHADFHRYAADVIHAVQRGESDRAMTLLQKDEYPRVSNRIKSMLAGLSLEFDFS